MRRVRGGGGVTVHGARNEGPRVQWGPRRSTKGRDEPRKDTDLAIREDATAKAAE